MKSTHFLLIALGLFLALILIVSLTNNERRSVSPPSTSPSEQPTVSHQPFVPNPHDLWTDQQRAALSKEEKLVLIYPLLTDAQAKRMINLDLNLSDFSGLARRYEEENWKRILSDVLHPTILATGSDLPCEQVAHDGLVQYHLATHPNQSEAGAREFLCELVQISTSASWDENTHAYWAERERFKKNASCSLRKYNDPSSINLLDDCPTLQSEAPGCPIRSEAIGRVLQLYPSLKSWQATNVACSAVYIYNSYRVGDLLREYRLRKR